MATKFVSVPGAATKIVIPVARAIEIKARALASLKGWTVSQARAYLTWLDKHERGEAERKGLK